MSTRSFLIPDPLYDYVADTWIRDVPVLAELRDETAKMEEGRMQISPEQGQFMAMLVKLMGVKKILEVGVFTGYSSTVTALALPDDGHIVACDVSEEFTAIARKYWRKAGVENKIELRIAPAIDTLDNLLKEGAKFDFCFIDADKPNYAGYFERAVKLVRSNGLIAIDNVLWHGEVADASNQSRETNAIREINKMVANDPRVEACLLPIGDGLTLARVK